jgi:hypothetical protein
VSAVELLHAFVALLLPLIIRCQLRDCSREALVGKTGRAISFSQRQQLSLDGHTPLPVYIKPLPSPAVP